MGFAVSWIIFSLVCAVAVLAISGRVVKGSNASETRWNTWRTDISYALRPWKLRARIALGTLTRHQGPSQEQARNELDSLQQDRRRARDITKMAYMDDDYMSNTSIEDFFSATQTTESAYADVDRLSDKLENIYETVQDRRAALKSTSNN